MNGLASVIHPRPHNRDQMAPREIEPTEATLAGILERTGLPVTAVWRWQLRIMLLTTTDIDTIIVATGRSVAMATPPQTLLMLIHDLVRAGELPQGSLAFKCSTNVASRFLKRIRRFFAAAGHAHEQNETRMPVWNCLLHFTFHLRGLKHRQSSTSLGLVGASGWHLTRASPIAETKQSKEMSVGMLTFFSLFRVFHGGSNSGGRKIRS
jgi:hypothetical protein